MQTTLPKHEVERFTAELTRASDIFATRYPGNLSERQPVHVVYGGAHLFKSDTAAKLGRLAEASLDKYAPDASMLARALGAPEEGMDKVHNRIREKLSREPVEDLRIDFEDGYGIRSDDEEDGHAITAAGEMAEALRSGTLPPYTGIRIKALTREAHRRAIRTLDLFVTALTNGSEGLLPQNFVVTLPKVVDAAQVSALVSVLQALEVRLGLSEGSVKVELMVETPQSIFSADGSFAVPGLVAAGGGRCRGVHFGAYDFTAGCGITTAHQDMLSSTSEFARNMMKVAVAGTGVWISDGATNVMPVPLHRGDDLSDEQLRANRDAVWRAWSLHYTHCLNSLSTGFYQGWDLHPAQLVSRYAAVYSFFQAGFADAAARLKNFVEQAARATMVGDVFDDAATGEGLLNYFSRGIACGAVTIDSAAEATGLSREELSLGTFRGILTGRGLITG